MISTKKLEDAKKIVIMLHGRGGSAKDILSLSHHLPSEPCYVAITAKNNQWYPLSFLEKKESNNPYLQNSLEEVKKLINTARMYVEDKDIYLLGFSQGACLALEFLSNNPSNFGGVFALSGGLIGADEELKSKELNTKILIGCSENDPFIPIKRVYDSKKILEDKGANITIITYPGSSHTITQKELDFIKQELS